MGIGFLWREVRRCSGKSSCYLTVLVQEHKRKHTSTYSSFACTSLLPSQRRKKAICRLCFANLGLLPLGWGTPFFKPKLMMMWPSKGVHPAFLLMSTMIEFSGMNLVKCTFFPCMVLNLMLLPQGSPPWCPKQGQVPPYMFSCPLHFSFVASIPTNIWCTNQEKYATI